MAMRKNGPEDFWAQVQKGDSCWEWVGALNMHGYGKIRWGEKYSTGAHRVSFLLHNGYWPRPCCLHTCDNRKCVNPAHLYQGTDADNAKDRAQRERNGTVFGCDHVNSKLSFDDIGEILHMLAQQMPLQRIAERKGVSSTIIARISRGLAYTKEVAAWCGV